MLNLKATVRKYKVALLLSYIPLLVTLVISYSNLLPQLLIDYRVPTIAILLIVPILYSYILVLKNHIEDQNAEIQSLNKRISETSPIEKMSLISSGKFQFDSKIGFYKNIETEELFCSPCLLKDIPAQLKEFDNYWRCSNCGYWYYKPGYKPTPKSGNKGNSNNYVTDWKY